MPQMNEQEVEIVNRFNTALSTLIAIEDESEEAVFKAAARALGEALNYRWTGIGTFDKRTGKIDLQSFYQDHGFSELFSYPIAGTPCGEVYSNTDICFFDNVAETFPEDEWLQDIGARAYHGALIRNDDEILGHVFAIDDNPDLPCEFANALVALTAQWSEKEIRYRRTLKRAQAAERLAIEARHAAEEANKKKSEFLASMSHELRTPLNAILGFSDILAEQYFGPPGAGKYREYAKDIRSSGQLLLELVNDLLNISSIEADEKELFKEPLDAIKIVEDCTHIISEQAHAKNIEYSASVEDGLLPFPGDKRAVKQIFLNIVSNAVKYTNPNGKVSVKVRKQKDEIAFEFSDTGQGIPADVLPYISDPFHRGNIHPHHAAEGWGLGLAISRSLVELHEGSFKIESEVNVGTTVTITFPAT